MKYGESTFDIMYLAFAVISGCLILKKASDRTERLIGIATLLLGLGDAFHLVPRVLNYFIEADFSAALGVGKLVTSLTMSVFYVLLYHIWQGYFGVKAERKMSAAVWMLLAVRTILCLLPQNRWLDNESDMMWGIIRNVPFVILGAIVCILYFRKRMDDMVMRPMWILVALSFLFYIPVAVGAGIIPMLGMLMLPKTICYIFMIVIFLRVSSHRMTM